jgi:hypothetical protein
MKPQYSRVKSKSISSLWTLSLNQQPREFGPTILSHFRRNSMDLNIVKDYHRLSWKHWICSKTNFVWSDSRTSHSYVQPVQPLSSTFMASLLYPEVLGPWNWIQYLIKPFCSILWAPVTLKTGRCELRGCKVLQDLNRENVGDNVHLKRRRRRWYVCM